MLDRFVRVASVSEVPQNGMIGVIAGDVEVCLARIDGVFYAVSNVCSHFYTWLSEGELLAADCAVQCPMHESRFSLLTGAALELPAEQPVEVFAVRVEGEEVLVGPR
jgi:nitrite reductase/ring-hydroxylating ferredoxin subunit